MASDRSCADEEELADQLEKELVALYGPVLTGPEVQKVLRYRSLDAYRKAMVRKTVPVPLFQISGQRGKFALAKDIAQYLVQQRSQVEDDQ